VINKRELITRAVRAADPSLAPECIATALDDVDAEPRRLHALFRALKAHPDGLRSGAPPSVGRFVSALRAEGSTLADPACVHCARTGLELIAVPEGGICPNCRRRALASACVSCGVVKPVAGRGADGQAFCGRCAPLPRRQCSRCGRVRIVAQRARGGTGDICDSCFKGQIAICALCGRQRPCNFATTDRPVCLSCGPRRSIECAHCHCVCPPSAYWPEGPVCKRCYRAALSRRGTCGECGVVRRLVAPPGSEARLCAGCAGVAPLASCRTCGSEECLYMDGDCVRCALALRARQLVGDDERFEAVYQAIAAAPQPYSAHHWVRSSAASAVLAEIVAGAVPLTHEALDAHPQRRGADYLRHLLVANGALARRDNGPPRLEIWVTSRLETLDVATQSVLRPYATWRVLRRARQRAEQSQAARSPIAHAKSCLNTAIAFLAFLDGRGVALAECQQGDIDAWLVGGPPSAPNINDFLEWAHTQKLVGNFNVPGKRQGEGAALDDDVRWAMVSRLLHDEEIELTDRVGGCLVLLYGQKLSRIVAITRDQVATVDGSTHLCLGETFIDMPAPLDSLLTGLVAERHRHRGVGSPAETQWLFPGLDPGLPLTARHLGERLRRLGISPAQGRRSALTYLGARLPAAVIARLLNLTPNAAVRWVGATGADWTTYAAHIAHRLDREP
jgi:hypothetical protein